MLCIQNGTVVTPEGSEIRNLWVDSGKIVAEPQNPRKSTIYDASGCLVFPGFIDAHVHLEMPSAGTWTADSYATGTAAAAAGGTTTVLDFATQDKGSTLQAALDTWHGRADGNCSCDYGFHMAVTDWNGHTRREITDMVRQGVTSFKAYMAYDGLRIGDDGLRELLAETREIGFVGVHCELGDEVNRRVQALLSQGHIGPQYHSRSRPNAVEAAAITRYLELAREVNAPAWVVHLSTREGLAAIQAARAAGQTVLVETCPQYLTLTDAVYDLPGFAGAKFVCSPPIRSAADRDAMLDAVHSGQVDILSTDHCSFNFRGQKELGQGDFSKIPNGLPGVEHRPAVVWSCCGLTPERFCALLAENPARAFGMYPQKGALLPGSDADVVVWDPNCRWELRAAEQVQNVDYSPWEGFSLTGRARGVFLRGELVAENGRVIRPGTGRYVARRIF
jgi:dihydropyrimidinase